MFTIVIPTLNEARRLPDLLATLHSEPEDKEIIVVDGGSQDGTLAIARKYGARTLSVEAGRGQQLAVGAAAAHGGVLLFLHADSRFPKGGLGKIADALATDRDLLGGNFRVLFDGDSDFARWLTGFYAWFRRHGLYYGDSAIFVRASIYHALGGIRPIALMEDYDFTRRLEKAGRTCCIDEPPLITSSRRFAGRHPVGIVCGWLWIHSLFALGVSPERLARLYDSTRRRQRPVLNQEIRL